MFRRFDQLGFWMVACIFCGPLAAVETPTPAQTTIRNINTDSGLPSNEVNGIAQTPDGYLWFATGGALARFDGNRFVSYTSRNQPAIRANWITSVAVGPDGALWAGTSGHGMVWHRGTEWLSVGQESGLENGMIKHLTHDRKGRLWVGTDGGGLFWESRPMRFERVGSEDPSETMTIYGTLLDETGRVWVGTHRGLWEVPDPDHPRLKKVEGQPAPLSPVHSLVTDHAGKLWIGTPKGIWIQQDSSWEMLPFKGQSGERLEIRTMLRHPTDGVWVSTGDHLKLIRRVPGGFQDWSMDLPPQAIQALTFDHEGSLWIGSGVFGAYQAYDTRMLTLGPTMGTPQPIVTTVLWAGKREELWVGTHSGLTRFRSGAFLPFSENESLKGETITSLAEDGRGNLWVGTIQKGVHRIAPGADQSVSRVEALKSTTTWALYTDDDGSIWGGGPVGFWHATDREIEIQERLSAALSNRDVRCFCRDHDGNLWIGTSFGLNRVSEGTVESFTSGANHTLDIVINLHCDADKNLWIGTAGNGLFLYRKGKFHWFGVETGLPENIVGQLQEDKDGYLWLGGGTGHTRVHRNDLLQYAEGKLASIPHELFGRSDGRSGADVAATTQPVSTMDPRGRVWFGTTKGLLTADPSRFRTNPHPPRLHIERIMIDRKDSPVAQHIIVPPGSQLIEIAFSAVSFRAPESVRCQYQLRGIDRSWNDAGSGRLATYGNLAPGKYEFLLRGANESGTWTPEPSSLQLTSQPWWYQTRLFRGGATLGLVAGLWGAYQLRMRRVRHAQVTKDLFTKRLLESQEVERKRIASELHDGLGQNLVIAANQAAQCSQSALPAELRQRLDALQTTLRDSISEMRAISRNLRPAHLEQLGLTRSIAHLLDQISESSQIQIQKEIHDISDCLEPGADIHIFRIIQEATQNTVKHSDAKRIFVRLTRRERVIDLDIEDDGKGFVMSSATDTGFMTGLGLISMRERTELLKGKWEMASQPGRGTWLHIEIPVCNKASKSESAHAS